jgi:exodeoxyribonuclease-3
MKFATFNANSIRARLDPVLQWLSRHQPDALCVQETKVQDPHFPVEAFAESGYHVSFKGMKAYNGVAIFTKEKPEHVFHGLRDDQEPDEPRLLHIVLGGIHILNTYVPQGFMIDSPKYAYKLAWYKRLRAYFDRHLDPAKPALWCGDMNVAPSPIDVHHPEDHEDHPCYHKDARAAYQTACDFGFVDVFRQLYPDRQQFTFFDYRYPQWRIDHILATGSLAARCTKVEVDLEPRMAPKASDHTFLWAEFDV